jgi:hypothetical protein
MPYLIAAAVVIALLVAAPLIRRTWTGSRLVTSLLTGQFDQSRVGRQFAEWFNERPARSEQRNSFVQFALGMGCPSGIVADRLMACIMKVWGGEGVAFGDTLVQELERLVVFDPPSTPEQVQLQQNALEQLANFKARLRSLDSPDK